MKNMIIAVLILLLPLGLWAGKLRTEAEIKDKIIELRVANAKLEKENPDMWNSPVWPTTYNATGLKEYDHQLDVLDARLKLRLEYNKRIHYLDALEWALGEVEL